MNNLKPIFCILLAAAFIATGCGAQNTPKAAVQKFIDAVENNDVKAMEEVTTDDTMKLVALYGWKMKGALADNGKVKSMSQSIDDDYATVNVIFENGVMTEIELIKTDGQWKIMHSMNK
ncbi:MAG: DUF4878 domain-containing protein [Treponema sp.]|nr:DUF4878 domain-containing protein [Treponema sp.]MCL2237902.1 DUF4878 domain-containing protein [Treponema sp.]